MPPPPARAPSARTGFGDPQSGPRWARAPPAARDARPPVLSSVNAPRPLTVLPHLVGHRGAPSHAPAVPLTTGAAPPNVAGMVHEQRALVRRQATAFLERLALDMHRFVAEADRTLLEWQAGVTGSAEPGPAGTLPPLPTLPSFAAGQPTPLALSYEVPALPAPVPPAAAGPDPYARRQRPRSARTVAPATATTTAGASDALPAATRSTTIRDVSPVTAYLPRYVLEHLASRKRLEPSWSMLQTVVLFIDVSGFSALTARLADAGPDGAENLSRTLQVYFGRLCDEVGSYGGDVINFAGDALICAWFESPWSDTHSLALQACKCATQMQTAMRSFDADGVELTLHIGVAVGKIMSMHVGNDDLMQYVLHGEAISQVAACVDASKSTEIVVSSELWKVVHQDCLGDERSDGLVKLHSVLSPVETKQVPAASLSSRQLALLRRYLIKPAIMAAEADRTWAELRTVTVLFGNLSHLADVRAKEGEAPFFEALQSALTTIQAHVALFGGHIRQFLGDDKGLVIIAVFGLTAHTDDPFRGVQAAHSIAEDTGARVGVTTGANVFCGAIGSESRREFTLIGDSINMSARLMSKCASQGASVLVDHTTYEQTRSVVVYGPPRPLMVKGREKEILGYAIRQIRLHDPAAASVASTNMSAIGRPFVGRQEPVSTLLNLGGHGASEGHLVVLCAERGAGKTRMARRVSTEFARLSWGVWAASAQPQSATDPYLIFHELLVDMCRGCDAEGRPFLEYIAHIFETRVPAKQRAHRALLNGVLGASVEAPPSVKNMQPAERAAATMLVLVAVFQGVADDFRASRPSSRGALLWLDCCEHLSQFSLAIACELRHVRGVVIGLCLQQAMAEQPQLLQVRASERVTWIDLRPLTAGEMVQLTAAELRCGENELPDEVMRFLGSKARGNPFVLLEILRVLREERLLVVGDDDQLVPPAIEAIRAVAIPDNVRGLVTARIDRLPIDLQLVLRTCAALVSFSLEILKEIMGDDDEVLLDDELPGALQQLVAQGFLTCSSASVYEFSDTLAREVIHSSTLFNERRNLHSRIAEHLVANGAQLALIAYHYEEAVRDDPARDPALTKRAVAHILLAAKQAAACAANEPAVVMLERAERYLGRLDAVDHEVQSLSLEVMVIKGPAMIAIHGPGHPEVEALYDRAVQLAVQGNNRVDLLFSMLLGRWKTLQVRQSPEALPLADKLLNMGRKHKDTSLVLEALHAKWTTAFFKGDFEVVAQASREGRELYDSDRPRFCKHAFAYLSHDPGACSTYFAAWMHALQGRPQLARQLATQSLAIAQHHAGTMAQTLTFAGYAYFVLGDPSSAATVADASDGLAKFKFWAANLELQRTWSDAVKRGYTEMPETVASVAKQLDNIAKFRMAHFQPVQAIVLASLCQVAGLPDQALGRLEDAIAQARSAGAMYMFPEMLRLRVELQLLKGPTGAEMPELDAALDEAADVAQACGTALLALRVAVTRVKVQRTLYDMQVSAGAKEALSRAILALPDAMSMSEVRAAVRLADEIGATAGLDDVPWVQAVVRDRSHSQSRSRSGSGPPGSEGLAELLFRSDEIPMVYPRDVHMAQDDAVLLLDVRPPAERNQDGFVAGSKVAPIADLLRDPFPVMGRCPKWQPLVVYCRGTGRSVHAARHLRAHGWEHVSVLSGGMVEWQALGLPVAFASDDASAGGGDYVLSLAQVCDYVVETWAALKGVGHWGTVLPEESPVLSAHSPTQEELVRAVVEHRTSSTKNDPAQALTSALEDLAALAAKSGVACDVALRDSQAMMEYLR